MKFRIRVTFLDCQVGGSLVKSMEFTQVPEPEDVKKMFDVFQPPRWKVYKVNVYEELNGEEVRNPFTLQLEDELLALTT